MQRYARWLALGLVLLFIGCAVLGGEPLLRDAQRVAGGASIEWRAPANGTVILCDESSGTLIATEPVNAGEKFHFDAADDKWAKAIKAALHVKVKHRPKIVLYFIPDRRQVQ